MQKSTMYSWKSAVNLLVLVVLILHLHATIVSGQVGDLSTQKSSGENVAMRVYQDGVAKVKSNLVDEGMELLAKALELDPGILEAKNDLAWLYQKKGEFVMAQNLYEDVLREAPSAGKPSLAVAASNNLGLIALIQGTMGGDGKFAEGQVANNAYLIRNVAIPLFRKALEFDPTFYLANYNLGNCFSALGEILDAEKEFKTVLNFDPEHVTANMNLGNLFVGINRFDAAAYYYRRAVNSALKSLDLNDPGSVHNAAGALNNLGQALREEGNFLGAMNSHAKVIEFQPNNIVARLQGIVAKRNLLWWENWEQDHLVLLKLISVAGTGQQETTPPYDTTLMPTSLFFGSNTITFAGIARRSVVSHRFDESKLILPPNFDLQPRRPLHIAYISYDMCAHPMGFLTRGLYLNHDRSRVYVTVIMYGRETGSEQQNLIRQAADHFVVVNLRPTDSIVSLIQSLGADVIIDLMAHTRGSRFDIVAAFPAKTYVNYLGYPGTSGISLPGAYIFTDKYVTPPEVIIQQNEITEAPVFLPDTYQANDFNGTISFCSTALGLARFEKCRANSSLAELFSWGSGSRQPFRFANLNILPKMEPASIEMWSNILIRVPFSVLLILHPKQVPADYGNATENILSEFAARGVDRRRIVLVPKCSRDDHLARLPGIDLFVDSLGYGAHSTGTEVLWSGVPMIAMRGMTFATRVGVSLLSACGLDELIVNSVKEFENLAVRLANNPTLYYALRTKLGRNLLRMPLFDTKRITRHLERAVLATQNPLARKPALIWVAQEKILPNHLELRLKDYIELAVSLLNGGNQRPAVHVLWRILASVGVDNPAWEHLVSNSLHLLGIAEDDPTLISWAISLSPHSMYYSNLGHVLNRRNHTRDAVNAFFVSIKRAGNEGDFSRIAQSMESISHICFAQKQCDDPVKVARGLVQHGFAQFQNASSLAENVKETANRAVNDAINHFLNHDKKIAGWLYEHTAVRNFEGGSSKLNAIQRLYHSGVCYGDAGFPAEAVRVHFQAVLEENKELFNHDLLVRIREKVFNRFPALKNQKRIVFYCHEYGNTWWPNWGPRSPENKGAGGSEEAVIFLSKELAKLGYLVEVYADPLEDDFGITPASGGVVWLPHTTFDTSAEDIELFVAWRYHVSLALGQRAKKKMLWLQDLLTKLGPQFLVAAQRNLVDVILGISKFHTRDLGDELQPFSAILGNGIQSEYLVDGENSNQEFIYASAPNRGLEQLLEMWPYIHHAIPQARLRIYYGFTNSFLKWGQAHLKNFETWLKTMKARIAFLEDGFNVQYIGMVDHRELAVAFARSGFTLYPTTFPETGCVSLMKAMALGSIPITSRYHHSTLPELTQNWDLGPPVGDDGDYRISANHSFLLAYAESVIAAVKTNSEENLHRHREQMKAWARSELLWSSRARQLVAMAFSSPN